MAKRIILRSIISVAAFYVMCVSLIGCVQRDLIYSANNDLAQPEAYGLQKFQEHLIKTSDGESLIAWYKPSSPNYPTMLYFHGNAGHIGHRAERFAKITEFGYGLLALSYRGFGRSTGSPTEEGLYIDARAALHFLKEQGLREQDIIYRGESLGTGVAVHLATETDPLLVALSAPYSSVTKVAKDFYPWVPVDMLLKDKYDSFSKIQHVKSPVIIFHGKDDQLIPMSHAKDLFENANEPKRVFYLENTSHNNIDQSLMITEITQFLKELGKL